MMITYVFLWLSRAMYLKYTEKYMKLMNKSNVTTY